MFLLLYNYYFRMYGQYYWFSICIVISAYVIFIGADLPANDGDDIKNHVTGVRWPRALPTGIGRSFLVRRIMKGTKEAETMSTKYRKFFKQGTEDDAISDFNALGSHISDNRRAGAIGVADGVKFRLSIKDKSNSWLPTMRISDPNMPKSIKIVYIDKPV